MTIIILSNNNNLHGTRDTQRNFWLLHRLRGGRQTQAPRSGTGWTSRYWKDSATQEPGQQSGCENPLGRPTQTDRQSCGRFLAPTYLSEVITLKFNASGSGMYLEFCPNSKYNFIMYGLPASLWLLAWLILRPWRWRRNVPPKRLLTFNWLYCVTSQKTEGLLISLSSKIPLLTAVLEAILSGCCFNADRISDSTIRNDWADQEWDGKKLQAIFALLKYCPSVFPWR
jgi:hypothetical protein